MTNLDKALKLYPKAEFTNDDTYKIVDGYEIEWSGDGELFYVMQTIYDRDVGYVALDDLYNGNFDECLKYITKEIMGDFWMNRQKFMEYFRSQKFDEQITVDDRIEIFSQCLMGSSDITKELLEQLFQDYSVENLKIITKEVSNV